MLRRSDARCPRCRGCLPFDGDDHSVCRCGSQWGPPEPPAAPAVHADLRELVKVLAEWITNPGPTDAERAAHNDHLETS